MRDELVEGGCLIPIGRLGSAAVAKFFIGEEEENVVLPDGAADAASDLVESIVVALERFCIVDVGSGAGAVVALVGVETGAMEFEERAAVELIGAVLGDDEDLSSAVTAIGRVVGTGLGLHFFYRFFVRRDDGTSAPGERVHLAAVDLEGVSGGADAVGLCLCAIFYLEDAAGGTAAADSTVAGK